MSATRGRLLVVDDDLVQRVLIGKIGAKLGYETVVASSYEAATELLAREAFEIMALDLSLGGRDGVELLRYVAAAGLRAMSIVIISGCDDRVMKATRRVANGLKLSVGGCLTKPLDLNRLRSALELPRRAPLAATSAAPQLRITPERIMRGLADREFFVEFQPKIALESRRVVGAEALARWRTAEFGMVSPMIFIPIAEEAGLMREVTDCILSSAMSQGRKLIERNPGFTIAVNISGSLMSDLALPDRIEEILGRENICPSSLTVEITETTAMADVDRANDILVRLRIKKIGTAIDDFGTGYSSLALGAASVQRAEDRPVLHQGLRIRRRHDEDRRCLRGACEGVQHESGGRGRRKPGGARNHPPDRLRCRPGVPVCALAAACARRTMDLRAQRPGGRACRLCNTDCARKLRRRAPVAERPGLRQRYRRAQ